MNRFKALCVAIILSLLTLGCGKSGKKGRTSKSSPVADLTKAAAEATGLVPSDLKGALGFEQVKLDRGRLMAVVPKGWKKSPVVPGSYTPPGGSGLGFMTKYSVGSDCQGSCEPKDWASVADKAVFSQFKQSGFSVTKDEKLGEDGRIVIAASGDKTYVAVALWKKGKSSYFQCTATLDSKAKLAVSAFEKACRSMAPIDWR